MKKIAGVFVLFALLMTLSQCNTNTQQITISGYTATDAQGQVISADADDWRTSASVPNTVMDVLNGMPIQNSGTGVDSFCGTITPFPNPNTGRFVLAIDNSCSSNYWVKYVIVDQQLHNYTGASLHTTSGSIRAAINISSNAGLYRVYYAMYDNNNNPFARGYGDISKQ